MELSPENREPIVLSQENSDAKWIELDMLPHFNDTDVFRRAKVTKGVDEPASQSRRPSRTDWKWESFERKSDGKTVAILKIREKPTQEEEWHILQFEAQDGTLYFNDDMKPEVLGL